MNFDDIIAEKMKLYEQQPGTNQVTQPTAGQPAGQPASGQPTDTPDPTDAVQQDQNQEQPEITPEQLLAFALKMDPTQAQKAGIDMNNPTDAFEKLTKYYIQSATQQGQQQGV